jgi:aryl-alcohol dehydrogenase-like predicted oxidoreductase
MTLGIVEIVCTVVLIVPAALHNGIGLLPWSPLAGGFLTGKYQRGTAAPSDTRAGSEKPIYQWIF